ncbi:MAG: ATP-binding protein [Candidatus Aenigmarchaeota archaeon]|nr:ATP-binding protein [Candidatus Aenigmarchaeota archaeon]
MVYVERDMEAEIEKYMEGKEILAVVGPRQCGKTTMINRILDKEEESGKKVDRVSFDDQKVLSVFERDIDSFVEIHVKGKDILFIDEVHYSKQSGKKLKYIYDKFEIKMLISGSSSPEMSIYSLKYLVGRILLFTLQPFSFGEFLSYKEHELMAVFEKGKYKKDVTNILNKFLEEYILFGGFPRVVLAKSTDEKKKLLEGILNTYILREIKEILDISEDYKIMDLLKSLSLQIGNIINYNELSTLTGYSYLDLKKYLNVLEKTFICSFVRPFFTNKRTELVKNPKVYFFDTGFRNVCIDNFTKERVDKGSIYENFVFVELVKRGEKAKFWNTKSSAEMDFVIEKEGKMIPIEVKSKLKEEKVTKSYDSFIKKYSPLKGYLVSLDLDGRKKVGGCDVIFLPFVKFSSLGKI